jgi:toxin-antitoxin system PIN domain toxin
VIALDTNVLVHAHRVDSPFHAPARDAVAGLLEGTHAWTIPWPCLHEFLATVTHRRVFPTPTPMELALAQVEQWQASPGFSTIGESAEHWRHLRELVVTGGVVGPKVHDARVAAICLSHGVRELWSADRDFGRFPALKVRNPLVG